MSSRLRTGLVLMSLAAASFGLVFFLFPAPPGPGIQARAASAFMEEAMQAIQDCRAGAGVSASTPGLLPPGIDPSRAALVGTDFSPITSTRGNLAAKLTATDPRFAALVVDLLRQAGVRPGEAVAVGASGSFPGLLIATVAACRALQARPLFILSLGSSQWGANLPGFSLLEQFDCLRKAGLAPAAPLAVSLGGDGDLRGGLDTEGAGLLRAAILRSGLPFLEEQDQVRNVLKRIGLYEKAAGSSRLAAFINIGGASANVGRSRASEALKPGLNRGLPPVRPENRGVAHELAGRGLPVIHLLEIRRLAGRYGIARVEVE